MLRAIDRWLVGYLRSVMRRPRRVAGPRHLLFCVADHFEPFRDRPSEQEARELVGEWAAEYRRVAAGIQDADGRSPRHTFFYPAEEYDEGVLDILAGLCRDGHGEVEIHLHHRNDTGEALRAKLEAFRDTLSARHGLLGRDFLGRVRYGFVHGNWALGNSRPDGDWCGVNEELGVLSAAGCFADFTFPSAPSPTQPGIVNAIYYARDVPGQPRGADAGVRVAVGRPPPREARGAARVPPLMLLTGPLALNWRRRKWGVLPRLENGALTGANPPSPLRAELWARQGIHVKGRPEWVFVKVHTHGCVASNRAAVMGAAWRRMHAYLGERFNDGHHWRLHYASARELYNMVKAAEAGKTGTPGDFRDYDVSPPPASRA
jgi:hypothetical protein